MSERKTKAAKPSKRARDEEDVLAEDVPPAKRAAKAVASDSSKRLSKPFQAPGPKCPLTDKVPGHPSSDMMLVEPTSSPEQASPEKAKGDDDGPRSKKSQPPAKAKEKTAEPASKAKGKAVEPAPKTKENAAEPAPTSTKNKEKAVESASTPAKGKEKAYESASTSAKDKENKPPPAHTPKPSVYKPFVPPKIMNPAALKTQTTVSRTVSHAGPVELTLIEKRDLLKRAIRLTTEDEATKDLIAKWRSVGREVASDLCQLIKESGVVDTLQERSTSRSSSGGGFEGSWGFGPRVQSRYEKSWGWLDADKKPEGGWGWASVNDHLSEGKRRPRDDEYYEVNATEEEQEEVELPSAERLKKELEAALNQPYKKRKSLLPLADSDAFYEATKDLQRAQEEEDAYLRKKLEALEKSEKKKAWGISRMFDELGIPQKVFRWDDEAEDWEEIEE